MADGYHHDLGATLAAVIRIQTTAGVTDTDVRSLAFALLDVVENSIPAGTVDLSDHRVQLARAFLKATLSWAQDAYWEDTCGDCIEGRCHHWGGATSRASIQAAKHGREYEDPVHGTCGCARHATSVLARTYRRDTHDETVLAWQAAKDAGEAVPVETDDPVGIIWVSRGTLTAGGAPLTDETVNRLREHPDD